MLVKSHHQTWRLASTAVYLSSLTQTLTGCSVSIGIAFCENAKSTAAPFGNFDCSWKIVLLDQTTS